MDLSDRSFQIASLCILFVAALLRLFNLALVPLHHDEGVNGNFLVRLVREGAYQYDPANYHGPTLYYFTAIVSWILKFISTSARDAYGLNTVTIRLVPAVFGIATIWLLLSLRRRIGSVAALSAALLLAVSPGAVYLSRYFIHETLFVFFTLGIVVAGLRFYERRSPVYLMLAAVSAALLFATKETAMISAGVLIIALVVTQVYLRLCNGSPMRRSSSGRKTTQVSALQGFVDQIGGPMQLAMWIALALLVFLAVNVLFYSSFFTNYPKGVYDALKTFDFWTKTGKQAHVHPPQTYLTWLMRQESALLLLGSIGAGIAFLKPKNPFAVFCGLWSFGLIAAYSLVPYKTPWLTLNFLVPLALVSGYAIQAIFELDKGHVRLPIAVMLASVVVGLYQTIDLNFFNYDNDAEYYVYVYAHTKRGTIRLVENIDKLAQRSDGLQTGITIVSPDYWPLPWYLRNYTRVGYFGRMTASTEPLIIASESQRAEVEGTMGDSYAIVSSGSGSGGFDLRPGVTLLLYARRNLLSP